MAHGGFAVGKGRSPNCVYIKRLSGRAKCASSHFNRILCIVLILGAAALFLVPALSRSSSSSLLRSQCVQTLKSGSYGISCHHGMWI